MYNAVHAAFKIKRNSQGDIVLHNTIIKIGTGLGGNSAMDHAYFKNYLAIGCPTGGVNWGNYVAGRPFAGDLIDPDEQDKFHQDVVGVAGTESLARIGDKSFSEVESNGVEKITLEEAFHDVKFPNPPIPDSKAPDLRLRPVFPAVDAGIYISNFDVIIRGKLLMTGL